MHCIHGYRNHRLKCHKMVVFVNLFALIVSFGVLVCHQRKTSLHFIPTPEHHIHKKGLRCTYYYNNTLYLIKT